MQAVTGHQAEAVLDELPVFRKGRSFQYPVAAVSLVVEQRVSDILHVDADLVRAPRFEAALDEVHVAEPLEHAVVRDGMLARFAVGKYGHLHPVAQAAADVSGHGAFVGLHVAPYQRVVDPVDRMVE